MKGIFAVLAVTAALAGCSKDPVASAQTNNQQVKIDELFTHDGVTIYRFFDRGNAVYFGVMGGDAFATRNQHCGKSCSRQVTTPTIDAN